MTITAQTVNSKGVIVGNDQEKNSGTTYAVVIGISDYKEVTDLNYADRDARVFADYLVSKDGMGLDSNNVSIFLNDQATLNNIGNALSDIMIKKLVKGDRIIFFFSGHGDYDADILKDQALLLLHGAPKQNYFKNIFSGDFISTADLNSRFIDPLSAQGCEVILLIDACHANGLDKQLSGGTEGGRVTAMALQNMTAPVKIYSCKSDQYSLESDRWGGGRGLFSYILMEGLYGMADTNNDSLLTFKEIQRYLEDNIPRMAAPNKQYPIVKISDPEAVIVQVNQGLLAAYKNEKNKDLVFLAKADTKGGYDAWIQNMDSIQKILYRACDSLINKKETTAALHAFTLFAATDSSSNASLRLRRNLSAAMQEKAAGILIPMLKESDRISPNFTSADTMEIRKAVNDLEIAAELLGGKHFLYRNLVARILFLRSLTIENNEGITCLELSLALEPNAPYTCLYLANRFQNKNYPEKAISYYQQYIDLMPKSVSACFQAAKILLGMNECDESIKYFKKTIELRPDLVAAYDGIGSAYYLKKDYDQSISITQKILEMEPAHSRYYYNLACLYSLKKNKQEGLKYFELFLKMKEMDLISVENDPDLNHIRSTAEFKIMLQKYVTADELAKYPGIYKPAVRPLYLYQVWPTTNNKMPVVGEKENNSPINANQLRKLMYASADSLVYGSIENTDGNMEGNRWVEWNTKPGNRGSEFTETSKDESSVYLKNNKNDEQINIDLVKNTIEIYKAGSNQRERFTIIRKEAKINLAAVVFNDKEFKGESLEIGGDIDWIGVHWNDRISSIHVNKGYKLQVFYDIFYKDRSLIIEGDWIAPPGWDNRISSIKVLKK